jgi:ketopantoate reductase
MCPACMASTAVMVAGAGSTGGILAVCIAKFGKIFTTNRLHLFQKTQEKQDGNK